MKTQTLTLPFGESPVLDFEASAAQLEVKPVKPGESPRLEYESAIEPDVTVDGETVRVRQRTRGFWSALEAGGARAVLHVPPTLKARINADMGRLVVGNLAGCDLDISTSAGSLELTDVRGRLKLRANAGQIRGEGLGGTFWVDCGAGSARLGIVALDVGEHYVHSNMGSVRIDLAPGLDVRIDARTVMGSTRTKYPTNPKSSTVLKLEAELGSVKIGEGGAYEDPKHGDWADWRKLWQAAEAFVTAPIPPPAPAAPAAVREVPPDELKQILSMVEAGKINATEAARLIRAIAGQ